MSLFEIILVFCFTQEPPTFDIRALAQFWVPECPNVKSWWFCVKQHTVINSKLVQNNIILTCNHGFIQLNLWYTRRLDKLTLNSFEYTGITMWRVLCREGRICTKPRYVITSFCYNNGNIEIFCYCWVNKPVCYVNTALSIRFCVTHCQYCVFGNCRRKISKNFRKFIPI